MMRVYSLSEGVAKPIKAGYMGEGAGLMDHRSDHANLIDSDPIKSYNNLVV